MSDIDTFNVKELEQLINVNSSLAISIYLPTHLSGRAVRQDHIQLKDLLREVETKLKQQGLKSEQINNLLDPVFNLMNDLRFWDYQSKSLVLFIGDNFFKYYRLPIETKPETIIDPRFYIAPLLPLITNNGSFYILAISENSARLFQADMFSISEVHVPHMPQSMGDALWYKKFEKEVQFHTETGFKGAGAERDAVFHGQADWIDKHKKYIVEYMRQVNDSLKFVLQGQRKPLIIATAKGLFPLYEQANTYKNLFGSSIEGNPEHYSEEELHLKAWQLLRPEMSHVEKKIVEDYKNFIGSKRFITKLDEILPAASDGLVRALFINKDTHIWGEYNSEDRKIKTEKRDTVKNSDLINLALVETITKKGEAYVLPKDLMPTKSSVAAVLRYDFVPPTSSF